MSESPQPAKSVLHWVLLASLITAAIVATACYYLWIIMPVQASQQESEHTAAQIVGLNNIRISHHLSSEFTDADGKLVADPPSDPAKQLDPDPLTFSWIGEDNQSFTADDLKPFTNLLAQATGKQVKFDSDIGTTDDEIRSMQQKQLHIAIFSTGAVPSAVNEAGFVPVGILASDSGAAKYRMEIIVPAASAMQNVNDLKDHELALTDPSSNAGYKAPIVLLRNEFGLVFERDYKTRATLSYDNSIKGIAKGQYDAAAVASDVIDRAVSAGTIKTSDFRVLYKSAEFPRAAVGYVSWLKPDLAAKIKAVLLSCNFKGTALGDRFAEQDFTHFAPLDYRNDWELVRLIDDTISGPQEVR